MKYLKATGIAAKAILLYLTGSIDEREMRTRIRHARTLTGREP
jgi:hypothetical protein